MAKFDFDSCDHCGKPNPLANQQNFCPACRAEYEVAHQLRMLAAKDADEQWRKEMQR